MTETVGLLLGILAILMFVAYMSIFAIIRNLDVFDKRLKNLEPNTRQKHGME